MNYDAFERMYFGGLSRAISDLPPEELVACIWAGTKAMVLNDGSKPNREAFAEVFSAKSGLDYYSREDEFRRFYETGFQNCVQACQPTALSAAIVHTLQRKGYLVAIATNPLFPEIATHSRLRWLGLEPTEFPLVTTFETSCSAKPNPAYYLEVCRRLGVKPEDCIMVGNDVTEDGVAAKVGMEVVLVKDCLINKKELPLDAFCICTLQDVLTWAEGLPSIL